MTENERNEEEFSSMSLGDHLEELRMRIILSLAGVVLGLVVCLFFGKYLTAFLERPYDQAMGAKQLQPAEDAEQSANESAHNTEQKPTPPTEMDDKTDDMAHGAPTNNLRPSIGLQTKKPAEGFITYSTVISSPALFHVKGRHFLLATPC